ncbi:MAG: hypothetical protein RLZ98_719 [Pseudomonadota bacterium]|jgi:3-(3-hydroxy-phenyl)propionate hydroxylase
MIDLETDVAIVGAGPTGLTLANLLGIAGVRTLLVERNASTVQEPRAVSIDDESLRTLQATGLIDAILPDLALDYGAHYHDPKGRCFAKVEPATREYGYPRRSAFEQPRLEQRLRDGLERFAHVEALFSHSVNSVRQDGDCVVLSIACPDGTVCTVRAAYAAGTDGAHSLMRRSIGARLQGATYDARWLILDLGATRERLRQTRVMCNPARPAITLPGPRGIRRYEFLLQENEDEAIATSPDFVRRLLADNGPDADAPIVRKQVYHFHARMVDHWSQGRIFLAGDAAHLTPPFAGQGMNSGVRDAHALAWRLAAVVNGQAGPQVLQTYEEERAPHAKALIQLAINIGRVMMPTSRLQAAFVHAGFRAMRLVPPLHAYFAQMKYKPKPYYQSGSIVRSEDGKHVGRMIPQPLLEDRNRQSSLLDNVVGNRFAVIAYGDDAQDVLDECTDIDFGPTDPIRMAIVPMRTNIDPTRDGPAWRDTSDGLAEFVGLGPRVLVVRPDRYVMASCAPADTAKIAAKVARVIASP